MGAGPSCSQPGDKPCGASAICGSDGHCGYPLNFQGCSNTAPTLACAKPYFCDDKTNPNQPICVTTLPTVVPAAVAAPTVVPVSAPIIPNSVRVTPAPAPVTPTPAPVPVIPAQVSPSVSVPVSAPATNPVPAPITTTVPVTPAPSSTSNKTLNIVIWIIIALVSLSLIISIGYFIYKQMSGSKVSSDYNPASGVYSEAEAEKDAEE